MVRDLKSADMGRFANLITEATRDWDLPPITSEFELEQAPVDAEAIILHAIEQVAPLRLARNSSTMDYWDSVYLQDSKRRVKKAHKKARRAVNPQCRLDLNAAAVALRK